MMMSEPGPRPDSIPQEWKDVLATIIAEATHFYPCPPADFDPLKLSDHDVDGLGHIVDNEGRCMEQFGLPPRPDEDRFPLRYEFWRKMFSGKKASTPVTFLQAGFKYEDVEVDFDEAAATSGEQRQNTPVKQGKPRSLIPYRRSVLTRRRIGRGIAGRETSVNWCGAYVTAHDGRIITEVHGSWTVPEVDVPAGIPLSSLKPHEELRCSSWLGLDGQRGYLDASLPQIGTSQFVKKVVRPPASDSGSTSDHSEPNLHGRQPDHGAWWQWWLRGVPNPPPIRLPLEVEPDDEIMASLFVVSPTKVKYLIVNHTRGVVCTPFTETEPSFYLSGVLGTPPLQDIPVRVSGATAEWITERPVNWTTGEADKLPFFKQVVFDDCHVVLGRAPGVDELEEQPRGTQLIRATSVDKDEPRTVTVARAVRRGLGTFTTTFAGRSSREPGGPVEPGSTSGSDRQNNR
jgi:hypothetical protein